MTKAEMNAKIAEIRRLEKEATLIKDQLESLRDELKAELDFRKVDSVDTGLHRVFYNCYEKSGVDSEKLRAAGLYDTYSKKSIVTQFKITDIKVI